MTHVLGAAAENATERVTFELKDGTAGDAPWHGTKSLFLFEKGSGVRKLARRLTHHAAWPLVMGVLVLLNCACSAARVVGEFPAGTPGYSLVLAGDYVFTVIFTLEAILKSISNGFVWGRNPYLRNNWNKFDFLMVLLG